MMTFKKYTENPTVSFDFDDTIFMLSWDDESNDYVRDENGFPVGTLNEKIADKIKKYKKDGYIVYVITSRWEKWKKETDDFLRDNGLMEYIDEVIFTNGSWKANTCKKRGVSIHHDDDIRELRRLKYKGIKGVFIPNEDVPGISKPQDEDG